MRFLSITAAVFLLGSMAFCVAAESREPAAEDKDAKISTKEVMAKAHKPPANLLRKVAQGKATDAEKGELLKLYRALAANAPPKGDKAKWTERTKLLVAAAEAAVKGEADAPKQLTKASDCMACHREHK